MPGSPLAGSVGFTLSQLGFATSGRFAALLAPLGLDPKQFALLRLVAQGEGYTQQTLADRLRIPASTMVALIDSLEQRHLVERRSHPTDRRVRNLYLAERGLALLDEAMVVATKLEFTICAGFDSGERSDLLAALGKLAANLGLIPGVHPGMVAAHDVEVEAGAVAAGEDHSPLA